MILSKSGPLASSPAAWGGYPEVEVEDNCRSFRLVLSAVEMFLDSLKKWEAAQDLSLEA